MGDKSGEGNFTWADRGEGNFTAWAKNQPNNFREEYCVHALGVKYNYEWNDVQCSDCHKFTCKKDQNECERNTNDCHQLATCTNERASYSCKCNHGYFRDFECYSPYESCSDSWRTCNCDKNDDVWREDSGLLTDKTHLPVKQLRFGDTGDACEQGYHTLGKLKCYGIA